jgi:UDP-N-acetylglucosamine 2-epimerase
VEGLKEMPLKVISVVGARPQFVKLGPVSRALRTRGVDEFVLHTGQHYDFEMSESFFQELKLPAPDLNLGIGGESPSRQVGAMVPAIADVLDRVRPSMVIVFGDTSSTLAAALAAAYAHVPVAHVEAGMRSFNRAMPEELNRVVVDHLSSLLLTPSDAAGDNLRGEGVGPVTFVGDVMYDVVKSVVCAGDGAEAVLRRYEVAAGQYVLATIHRAGNTDDRSSLEAALRILAALGVPVVFPVHPRTRKAIADAGLEHWLSRGGLRAVKPLTYVETMALAGSARRVFTDSGGLQKEAFYLGVPCTTLRTETEWVETVDLGWNVVVGTDVERAVASLALPVPPPPAVNPYGDGTSGERIAEAVVNWTPAS